MPLTDEGESRLVLLIFNNTNFADIGDATGLRGSTTAGVLWLSLHTALPVGHDQTSNEATYTSYARVSVARSGAGFACAGAIASNAAAVNFPTATGGSSVCTHFGVGTATSGTGHLVGVGAFDSSLTVSTGILPNFAIGALQAQAV